MQKAKNTGHASTAPAPTTAPSVPAHWYLAGHISGEHTWYVRDVGPWRLEVYGPEPDEADTWEGYAELSDTHQMRVEADSLAEAARIIEQMMATLLTSCLIGLVGGGLPDVAWETAIFLAEG